MSNDKYIPIKPFFKSGKVNDRTKNVEWEHIMPAENFGRHLSCWKEGDLLFKFFMHQF